MALPTTYSTGVATVNAFETYVGGQGTTWLTSGLQAGDLFWAGGLSVRIASVDSNTSLTLAFPWPGGARINASYEVRFTPDATRVLASARAVLDALSSGNVKAFGDLVSAADKLGYFNGAGTMSLIDFKAAPRQFMADNFYPVQQGGGPGQGNNKIKLGWASPGVLKATVDSSDLGQIWTDYSVSFLKSTAGFLALPSGLIFQWGTAVSESSDYVKMLNLAFPTVCLHVHLNQTYDVGLQAIVASASQFTPTSFVIRCRNVTSGDVAPLGSVPLTWFAIGY